MFTQSTDIKVHNNQPPKKKRKFKIFDNQHFKTPNVLTQNEQAHKSIESNIISEQSEPISRLYIKTEPQRQFIIHKTVEMFKIAPKSELQAEFYGSVDALEILDINLDDCLVSKQGRFQRTIQNDLFIETPSFILKNDKLIINEGSQLFHFLNEVKQSHTDLESEVNELNQSILELSQVFKNYESQKNENKNQLSQLQVLMQSFRAEKEEHDQKLKQISNKLENVEIFQELQSKDVKESKNKEELLIFVQENGYQIEMNEDDEDEFAESHILPASLIAQFLQHRRKRIQEQKKQREQELKLSKKHSNISILHPLFQINNDQYQKLAQYILEEFSSAKQAQLNLTVIFRRSAVDIQCQSIGEKQDLQYKQNIMFLIKTSTGKTIGGFISNCLVEEETMEDPHAFLFSLGTQCYKFKVKQQCQSQAYMANKFYLITFGTDLMISSNCLEEQSYCQWPSSYHRLDDESNSYWLAGDFEFMIEHIEVLEINLRPY